MNSTDDKNLKRKHWNDSYCLGIYFHDIHINPEIKWKAFRRLGVRSNLTTVKNRIGLLTNQKATAKCIFTVNQSSSNLTLTLYMYLDDRAVALAADVAEMKASLEEAARAHKPCHHDLAPVNNAPVYTSHDRQYLLSYHHYPFVLGFGNWRAV